MSTQPSQDDRTQSELLNDLRYGSPAAQEEALVRLAAVGEAEALDAVVDYLRSQPQGTSDAGFEALRVLAVKYLPLDRYSFAEALIPYLSVDEWSQRLAATRLLYSYPNEMATEPLRDLLWEAYDKVLEERRSRFSAARMLAERTLVESVQALAACGRLTVQSDMLQLLDDRALRPLATRGLGIIGSETDRDRLEDLAEDDDVRTRDAAQWALRLMDERADQFTRPPNEIPEPPPDRITPTYWAHRLLDASEDDFIQFLVVRVAVEHLMLDGLLLDGRMPEQCVITLREYEDGFPPEYRTNSAPIVGAWRYYAYGPQLEPIEVADRNATPPMPRPGLTQRESNITISYPKTLPNHDDEGLVSFDCLFEPFLGRGWVYRITWRAAGWTFAPVRRTWSS